jgi:hypothetical protein
MKTFKNLPMYYLNTLIIVVEKMLVAFSMPKGITFQSNKPTLMIRALTYFSPTT